MADRSERPDEFERLARQDQPGIAAEFLAFLRENKKWWMLPILILIGLSSLLVILAGTGAAPFLYTLF
jgi:hypothetical protein